MNLYCPDCGQQTLYLIELTEPAGDERKEVRACDCGCLVYIVRKVDDGTEPPPLAEQEPF